MNFILFLLFILLVGGGMFFLISSYEQKLSNLHHQLVVSKNQLSKLQKEYKDLTSFKKDFSIKFINVDKHSGIVAKDSLLYLSPTNLSPILQKLNIAMEVRILDKVLYDNDVWYYVALPIDTDINSRGWVLESCFSNFSHEITDIIR
ncbi:hypothetical protein KYD98_15415 [Clostridium sp. YB-6]|uniref:SH3b domain-containing protein n=2 Tax=Clostridium weizhouense TaxID=2859781 RepID=A0ABS7AST3_9CLOT|nr:hypothetical protein [Clostridium weizhouense]